MFPELNPQALAFEAAIDDLRNVDPQDGVGIENALTTLQDAGVLNRHQARTVVGLAAGNIDKWIRAAGADRTMWILAPIIDAAEPDLDDPQKNTLDQDLIAASSRILAESIKIDPFSYEVSMGGTFNRKSEYSQSQVLVGTLDLILSEHQFDEEDATALDESILRMVNATIRLDQDEASQKLRTIFTPEIALSVDPVLLRRFSTIAEFLKSKPDENALTGEALARVLVLKSVNAEEMLKKFEEMGIGNSFDIAISAMNYLLSEDAQTLDRPASEIDERAEDLWLEILNSGRRTDPKLASIREKAIGKDWYWDNESTTYTLLETMETMNIPVGEEMPFLSVHDGEIISALVEYDEGLYKGGLRRALDQGVLSAKLADYLRQIRNLVGSTSSDKFDFDTFCETYPDELMLGFVQIPEKPRDIDRILSRNTVTL